MENVCKSNGADVVIVVVDNVGCLWCWCWCYFVQNWICRQMYANVNRHRLGVDCEAIEKDATSSKRCSAVHLHANVINDNYETAYANWDTNKSHCIVSVPIPLFKCQGRPFSSLSVTLQISIFDNGTPICRAPTSSLLSIKHKHWCSVRINKLESLQVNL